MRSRDDIGRSIVARMLEFIGEDTTREGLHETPSRVVRAWDEWFSGYKVDPGSLFKTFADGAPKSNGNEMILVDNCPVYSHCEHHITPIIGVAHVAYIPNGRVVGLSKIPRLVDCLSRRLQVQERLTNQIADEMQKHLAPLGVGVVVRARHLCMESRGARVISSKTTTSALRGQILLNPSARNEFLELIRSAGKQ